tara:strand:- start:287 stop:541 length:255 start_codon:yes stop_codon:yes gene_type:complete
MTRAVEMANAVSQGLPLPISFETGSSNEDVFEGNLTVPANTNTIIAGPVTIPNVTINGNLSVLSQSLTVTTTLTIASAGKLFIK